MWILFGFLSILLTLLSWLFVLGRSQKAVLASLAALSCTAAAMLSEYHLVFGWVIRGDWGALSDVVPYIFHVLAAYVIFMILANLAAYLVLQKRLAPHNTDSTESKS